MLPITIIFSLIGIGILAAAHEIGHFLVAKSLGIKVYELSIFVGPKLFSFKKKGIEYNIRMIPFGAYVRFSDFEEEEVASDDPSHILNQPRWKRLLVSLAGPVMNVLLGVLILTILFSVSGYYTTIQRDIYPNTQLEGTAAQAGDRIISINGQRVYTEYDMYAEMSVTDPEENLTVGFRSADSGKRYSVVLVPDLQTVSRIGISHLSELTEEGGWKVVAVDPRQNQGNPVIMNGDTVLRINGVSVSDPEIARVVDSAYADTVTVDVLRDGTEYSFLIVPFTEVITNSRGFDPKPGEGLLEAVREAAVFPLAMFRLTVFSVRSAISGDLEPYNVVSGPVGMVTIVSDVVSEPNVDNSVKIESLALIAAVISIGLAITNLLPLPGLDGSDLIMLVIETIRGKKLSKKAERVINIVGFAVIILLVSFALTSDIIRLFK